MSSAQEIFTAMKAIIPTVPDLPKRVGAIFQFELKDGSKVTIWTVDLKTGSGDVYEGKPKSGKASCVFKLSEENFVKMIKKEANPQSLFMQGQLKLSGDMGKAMKFESVLKGLEKSGKAKL